VACQTLCKFLKERFIKMRERLLVCLSYEFINLAWAELNF